MKLQIRTLNEDGIQLFAEYLRRLRVDPTALIPVDLLTSPATRSPLTNGGEVESGQFRTRKEAGAYLHRVLVGTARADIDHNRALWSWLGLFYFDELCPIRKGQRKIGADVRYILPPVKSE